MATNFEILEKRSKPGPGRIVPSEPITRRDIEGLVVFSLLVFLLGLFFALGVMILAGHIGMTWVGFMIIVAASFTMIITIPPSPRDLTFGSRNLVALKVPVGPPPEHIFTFGVDPQNARHRPAGQKPKPETLMVYVEKEIEGSLNKFYVVDWSDGSRRRYKTVPRKITGSDTYSYPEGTLVNDERLLEWLSARTRERRWEAEVDEMADLLLIEEKDSDREDLEKSVSEIKAKISAKREVDSW